VLEFFCGLRMEVFSCREPIGLCDPAGKINGTEHVVLKGGVETNTGISINVVRIDCK
jgi:hypothetical protein